MRRKFSPFFLLLFEALFLFLLPHSESSSTPFIPSIHQLETSAPDFNVIASDDGVPVLEPGENPAKDPVVILDPPLSTSNSDQNTPPDFTPPKTNPPKKQSPSESEISKPTKEPANDGEEETDFGDVTMETPDDDGLSDVKPSSEFEDEDLSSSGSTEKESSGKGEQDDLLLPEPSGLPDHPPLQSDAKDSKGPTSSKGSSPGKASNSADKNPNASDKPVKKKPIGDDASTAKDDDDPQELEPSPLDADADKADAIPTPEATSSDASISPILLPTAIPPTPQSDDAVPGKPTSSDAPELSETEMKPTPEVPPAKPNSNSRTDDDSEVSFSEGFVRPNATYKCVNFATRKLGEYKLFDKRATDGSYTIYKGSGVALNPTLPMAYRYHAYGKNWTYHLDVTSDLNQNILLGFAEVFPKACASGRNGSFRVFTVKVGDDFRIVDVMKSSGCGVLQQAVFRNIKPKKQVIDLNFDAISGKAMLSVVCYGASDHAIPIDTPKANPNVDTPESGKNSGSSAGTTTEIKKQCFTFGKSSISGFTSVEIPELTGGVELYKDESASVINTDYPDVYKSHIFGPEFTLSLAAGVTHSVTVQLGFAEIFQTGCMSGFRMFTVKAGREVRTIDVFEEAGCSSAFTLELRNVLPDTSGEINIVFSSVSNFAMVSSVCIIDEKKGSPGLDKNLSLVITSGPRKSKGSELVVEEPDSDIDSDSDLLLPSVESLPEHSFEAERDEDDEGDDLELPQSSPYPEENGILVVDPPKQELDGEENPSPKQEPGGEDNPNGSPFPKVNGLIDATLTNSPSPLEDSENDTGAESSDSSETSLSAPEPSDELLPSDFSQTTIGEGSAEDPFPSPDLLVFPADPSSGSQPGSHGASGTDNVSLTPSVTAVPADISGPGSETGDVPDLILPTKTPVPIADPNVSDDGGTDGVVDKQGDITIEAASPSPSLLAVVIEAPTPSISPVGVAIEVPSPSSDENVTIIGSGSGATSTPTPSSISAAAFSPAPSAAEPAASPSTPSTVVPPSDTTPEPVVTAAAPNTASIEPATALSPSPQETSISTEDDSALPPEGSNPTGVATSQASISPAVSDGIVILPPVGTSPGPQGDPDGSGGGDGALSSPQPVASISQNQIIVPATSAVVSPAETAPSAPSSPLPQSSNSPDPVETGPGIGAPDGNIAGSAAPESSPQATPTSPDTTSSVGSSEVIVDSSTTTEPSPSPIVSTSIGAPDDGPVKVTDNTTEIIQVTGDVGSEGAETEKEPSILVGEYKDVIATTPAGRGFAIGMGIVGSLLVLLLLVCLFFAIFRGGGAAYSYSSGYSSHKPTDYDPSQGRYTDDLGLDPTGYGNVPSRGQSAQDGYGTDPVTFESRQEGQSESFGFEMPAAGGLGAPTEGHVRNEEPDTLAEYSSLHLQPATAYDGAVPELAENGDTHGGETGQSQSDPYQFTGVQSTYTEDRKPNTSYGSNPDDYTFTGTFTIPRTDFRPSQGRDDGQMDRVSHGSEQYLRNNPMTLDSFNDDHSIARPTNSSESSGQQERDFQNASGILQQSAIANTETPTNNASSSRDGILVDDVRSSLLDSEYESTASMQSLQSNPVTAPSPYETQFIEEEAAPDSGPYQELATPPLPRYYTEQSTEKASVMHFTPTEAAGQSAHPTSSGSNDGPWPSWWSKEDQRHQQPSGYATRENGRLETDSNFLTSHGVRKAESNGPLVSRISASTSPQTKLHSKVTETNSGLQRTFVPDSTWRRQYSSTSDEDESQPEVDPYFEELRRRREPYVRSVASRLSTGSGSLLVPGSGESAFETGINRFNVPDIGRDGLGPTRQMSHWISQDPVPV